MNSYAVHMGRRRLVWQSSYDFHIPQGATFEIPPSCSSVTAALENPRASLPLTELARKSRRPVIIVPDATRGWQKIPLMAEGVRAAVAEGTDSPVCWLVATGQHRGLADNESELILGKAMRPGDRLVSHNCDDTVSLEGVTPGGNAIEVSPDFAGADLVVMIGGIVHHDMAGFSGGRKSIMPGVSSRRAIVHNHAFCLDGRGVNSDTGCGKLTENPMALEMDAYARQALKGKAAFLLNVVTDGTGEPAAWVAGDPFEAWHQGTELARAMQTLWVPQRAKRVVTSCGGYPGDLDLYQATKAVSSILSALDDGAPVVLVAGLEDALGPGNFADALLRSLDDPGPVFDEMAMAFTIPGYIAAKTVTDMRRRPCALVTDRLDTPFPGPVFATMEQADAWLHEQSGYDGLSLFVPAATTIHVAVKTQ